MSRAPSPNATAIASRSSSHEIWISGASMNSSFVLPQSTRASVSSPHMNAGVTAAETIRIRPPALEVSALELTLQPLRPLLARTDLTDLCINKPGEAFLETRSGWIREPVPFADFAWCRRFAKLVANSTAQRIDEDSPIL